MAIQFVNKNMSILRIPNSPLQYRSPSKIIRFLPWCFQNSLQPCHSPQVLLIELDLLLAFSISRTTSSLFVFWQWLEQQSVSFSFDYCHVFRGFSSGFCPKAFSEGCRCCLLVLWQHFIKLFSQFFKCFWWAGLEKIKRSGDLSALRTIFFIVFGMQLFILQSQVRY